MSRTHHAAEFRRLHERRPLLLPNAWDPASARVIEAAGAAAIATTSAGVSWAHGRPDGQSLDRAGMVEAIRRILAVVAVPVTADAEGGYDDLAGTVAELAELGVAGVNIEDSADGALLDREAAAERIRLARKANSELVVNARTDVYLLGGSGPDALAEAIARGNAAFAAGADCAFVPGVIDEPTIAALVEGLHGPLNIMAMPGAPEVARLGELGVARVSVGSAITQAALAATERAARELLESGSYGALADGLPFGAANDLFSPR
ncbi:isocitrate lyase/phosphoenolpyruvate mutase family protein [Crossiella sp. CA-258035]|uniref:isocitrate lyase/PEP mutase family protein n=1 Tax=Crossiella sp. CA-258035 TaxID=2981138 RepID=UPI0024BC30C9|nr:isocitrate lyase/phosphoenolpyruvate mutase family protein [Crossiella sp. CA-258035]WHT22462.1 isocitrate lyase/phosphoenolpyruvate mutase family protein [Crossiella sp. CA-258035]